MPATAPSYRELLANLDVFTTAYLDAALWSTTDEDGDPLDANYHHFDFAPETLRRMVADCVAFQEEFHELIESDLSQAGHDFWLTREGHGCGFWDGDWPEEIGAFLTAACEQLGPFDLDVDDDGSIQH